MAQQIQLRNGTKAQWAAANTVLAVGEVGAETDTGLIKVGDGITAWNSKAYAGGAGTTAVAFSTTFKFDGSYTVAAPYAVTGPLAFTANVTNAVPQGSWNVLLVGNGADTPTFTGMTLIGQAIGSAAGQEYAVAAWYEFGRVNYGVALGQVQLLAPGQVSALASTAQTDTSMALSWTAPSSGGTVADYKIEYKLATASTWSVFSHTPSTATSTTITGLPSTNPGVAYNVRVSAINATAVGTASSTITATLSSTITVPAKMNAPVATAGAAQISYTFTTPANGGASIDSYRITLSTGETFNGATSPIVATGLTAIARTATVQAHNSIGYSPASDASNSVTPSATAVAVLSKKSDYTFQLAFPRAITPTAASYVNLPAATIALFTLTINAGGSYVGNSSCDAGSTFTNYYLQTGGKGASGDVIRVTYTGNGSSDALHYVDDSSLVPNFDLTVTLP